MDEKILNLAAELSHLSSEASSSHSIELDKLTALELVTLMNQQDQQVAEAVAAVKPAIAQVVDAAASALLSGGRIVYVGAGTSGRLGILDASEIPPTFSMPSEKVLALMAGGPNAMFKAQEGVEDSPTLGATAVAQSNVDQRDIVIGLAASGRTPFVLGALMEANKRAAATVGVSCNSVSPLEKIANISVCVNVGPEVLTGSTRLKSGTAQKMVLNMISTGAMVRIGKCFGNRMVDLNASNEKLKARAVNLVVDLTEANQREALLALKQADWQVKIAVLMVAKACSVSDATALLAQNEGQLRRSLESSEGA